jgi:hypothetical protein
MLITNFSFLKLSLHLLNQPNIGDLVYTKNMNKETEHAYQNKFSEELEEKILTPKKHFLNIKKHKIKSGKSLL